MADVLGNAVTIFQNLLKKDKAAKEALMSRGVDARMVKYFNLGATGGIGDFYYNIKKKYNYSDDILEDAGLLLTGANSIETFTNSIIIPIKDVKGRIISLSGRKTDEHPAKYINLPHRPIFDFYGIEMLAHRHMFKEFIGLDNPVFICEGQFDTMILQKLGLPALGILGVNGMRSVMFSHLRWFNSIVLCLDNDRPGQQATTKLASHIKHQYPDTKIYRMKLDKEGQDINSFYLEGNTHSHDFLATVSLIKDIKPRPFKKKSTGKTTTDERLIKVKSLQIKDFIDSVSKNTQWTKHGRLLKTRCPLPEHTDSVNSFTIYTESNSYFCFGCGCGGDIINFCMKYFGTNFKTALGILDKWSAKK